MGRDQGQYGGAGQNIQAMLFKHKGYGTKSIFWLLKRKVYACTRRSFTGNIVKSRNFYGRNKTSAPGPQNIFQVLTRVLAERLNAGMFLRKVMSLENSMLLLVLTELPDLQGSDNFNARPNDLITSKLENR